MERSGYYQPLERCCVDVGCSQHDVLEQRKLRRPPKRISCAPVNARFPMLWATGCIVAAPELGKLR
jgi:hypothetical protein